MVQTWAIAKQTVRDAVRKKVLLVLLIFVFALILASQVFPAFGLGARYKMVVTVSMSAMGLFGMVVAIFLSAFSIPYDIEEKRIYTVVTKPVKRSTLVTGRMLGHVLVCAIVLGCMALVTDVCLRLTPGDQIVAARSDMTPIYAIDDPAKIIYHASAGEKFVVKDRRAGGYEVMLPQHLVRSPVGFAKLDHVGAPTRAGIYTQRVLEAAAVEKYGKGLITTETGKVATLKYAGGKPPFDLSGFEILKEREGEVTVKGSALALTCGGPLGEGERWTFDLKDVRPADRSWLARVACSAILWKKEPAPSDEPAEPQQEEEPIAARIVLFNESSRARQELSVVLRKRGKADRYYVTEGWFVLPPDMLRTGPIALTVTSFNPSFRPHGTEWVPQSKGVIWKFSGFDVREIPGDHVTAQVNLRCIGAGMASRETLVALVMRARRPSDGKTYERALPVKDRMIAAFTFPKELVDPDGRVEVELAGMPEGYIMGIPPDAPSVYLLRKPAPLELGLSKAVLLLFLVLAMVVVATVACSTLTSAPVAILLGIFFYFCGNLVDFMKDYSAQRYQPTRLRPGETGSVLEESRAVHLFLKLFAKGFAAAVPNFSEFSATKFLLAGLDVPSKVIVRSLGYALPYVVVGYLAAIVIFRRREFM